VHRAKTVDRFVASTHGALRLHRLPAYSPQLNPDEWVWKNVKHDGVAPAAPKGPQQMTAVITARLRRLQRLPHIVRGFFADPGTGRHHRGRLKSTSEQPPWVTIFSTWSSAVSPTTTSAGSRSSELTSQPMPPMARGSGGLLDARPMFDCRIRPASAHTFGSSPVGSPDRA
jgi:DDE superfamily endonuclease